MYLGQTIETIAKEAKRRENRGRARLGGQGTVPAVACSSSNDSQTAHSAPHSLSYLNISPNISALPDCPHEQASGKSSS